MEDKHTPEKFELITEQQAFENKVVGVIKNLVHRSLQWEDGEIKGWDEQMITSLAPILLKPFFADLLAKVSEQQKEIDLLKKAVEEREQTVKDFNTQWGVTANQLAAERIKVSEQEKEIERLKEENEDLKAIVKNLEP